MMEPRFLAIMIALLVQAGGIVWWLAGLQAKVRHNDFQIQMMDKSVTHNSKFVLEWPSGSWLSGQPLPSDTRQDLKIEMLETQVDRLIDALYRINGHRSDPQDH
jgi:hypothetical protein